MSAPNPDEPVELLAGSDHIVEELRIGRLPMDLFNPLIYLGPRKRWGPPVGTFAQLRAFPAEPWGGQVRCMHMTTLSALGGLVSPREFAHFDAWNLSPTFVSTNQKAAFQR